MSVGEVKDAVRERDGYRCTNCGMTADQCRERHRKNLHVHRIIPDSLYTLDGCVTLCLVCHRKAHKKPRKVRVRLSPTYARILYYLEDLEDREAGRIIQRAIRAYCEANGHSHLLPQKPEEPG